MIPPKSSKILIVDDSKNMRELISAILHEMGYTNTLQAPGVDEAFEALNSELTSGQPVQMILADYDMPEKSGLDFINELRNDDAYSNLPFIVVSAHGQFNAIIDIISAGADAFIAKPFEKGDLMEKFEATWKKRQSA